jgi:hypothetical protein
VWCYTVFRAGTRLGNYSRDDIIFLHVIARKTQDCEEQELPPFDSMNIMKLLHKQVAAGDSPFLFWKIPKIHQNE